MQAAESSKDLSTDKIEVPSSKHMMHTPVFQRSPRDRVKVLIEDICSKDAWFDKDIEQLSFGGPSEDDIEVIDAYDGQK